MKLSESVSGLTTRFLEIEQLAEKEKYDKRRGWNRAVTEYVKRHNSNETRVRAAIKAHITRKGGDTSVLSW